MRYTRRIHAANQVVLHWQSENEAQILGYQLWRVGEDGAEVKITNSMIAAQQAGQSTGAAYEYVDAMIEPRRTYRYLLEVISLEENSKRIELGGIRTAHDLYLPALFAAQR